MSETTSTATSDPPRQRRSAGLVGNRLALAGGVLFLCEFVGIIASGVHTMPGMPGASLAEVRTMYAGQVGATGFLVGWYSLVLPGRVLYVLGLRRALHDSDRAGRTTRTLLDWAVALMAVGVVLEVASAAVLAGAAGSVSSGDTDAAAALDTTAHYLQVALSAPSGVATTILAVAMWRSGVFPRVLAGLALVPGVVQVLGGTLLAGPSTADLQDSLTVLNLLSLVVIPWSGILLFRRTPRRGPATA